MDDGLHTNRFAEEFLAWKDGLRREDERLKRAVPSLAPAPLPPQWDTPERVQALEDLENLYS